MANPNWKPGVSGNPSGRPKENSEVKALARQHGEAAIAKLVELLHGEDQKLAKAAADSLLDRGFGKPGQSVEMSGGLSVTHEQWLASLR